MNEHTSLQVWQLPGRNPFRTLSVHRYIWRARRRLIGWLPRPEKRAA